MTAAEEMLPHYYKMHTAVNNNRNFDLEPEPKRTKNNITASGSAIFEPWFSEPSFTLLESVMDFVKFLESNINRGNQEIGSKLSQLRNWSQLASQFLKMDINYGDNFVDRFAVKKQGFEIFDVIMNGNPYKVFMVLENEHDAGEFDEEEKSNLFSSAVANGFILQKCLRKVRCQSEQRDVWTAIRCEICTRSRNIIRVFSDEKFILKRVIKGTNEFLIERLRREFKVQSLFTELDFYAINKLYSYHEDENSIFTISYSAGDKDLLDALLDNVKLYGESFSELKVSKLFKSAAQGLAVSHNFGICHRDVSLENLVLNDSKDVKNPYLEIIDWGHSASKFIGEVGERKIKYEGPVGKERYFAPELFREFRDSNDKVYDPFKADVFAFGVCLFSSLVGTMPFSSINDEKASYLRESDGIMRLLKSLKAESKLSATAVDLLSRCMNWNPENRASMDEVLNHAFFKN